MSASIQKWQKIAQKWGFTVTDVLYKRAFCKHKLLKDIDVRIH